MLGSRRVNFMTEDVCDVFAITRENLIWWVISRHPSLRILRRTSSQTRCASAASSVPFANRISTPCCSCCSQEQETGATLTSSHI